MPIVYQPVYNKNHASFLLNSFYIPFFYDKNTDENLISVNAFSYHFAVSCSYSFILNGMPTVLSIQQFAG